MWQAILIIIAFLAIAALMIARKIPTLLALPLLAVLIAVIAGVPPISTDADGNAAGFLNLVIEQGAVRMASAYCAVIFGAWLGQLLNRTGVTETLIKKSAELGGDRPLVAVLLLSVVTALLFTVLSGLGSVIMVGSIVLPIFISIGIPGAVAGSIFLLAFSTGLCFNIANWQVFQSIFGLDTSVIRNFEIVMAVVTAVATLIFILLQFRRNGVRAGFSVPAAPTKPTLSGWRAPLAMITPLIPIVLVAVLDVPIISAFIVAILWILVFTQVSFKKAMNTLTKTCYDGITDAAPAVILMVGIGMLYMSVTHASVQTVLTPLIAVITPKNAIVFAIFFSVLAPLALYRGPLNLFGLGSGLAALMAGTGLLPVQAVMGGFLSAERVQSVGDPTNTQNVWVANYVNVDVNTITRMLLPYLWGIAIIGTIFTSVVYF
jgi:TRAP-type C4-dicarboxylate transport system permease large subunit